MGYRSDVVLKLDTPAYSALEAVAKVSDEVKSLLSDADTAHIVDDVYTYFWSSIKWYDMYKEIGHLDLLLSSLPPESYGFIRLGEESTDVEERGSPHDFDIHVTRRIEY